MELTHHCSETILFVYSDIFSQCLCDITINFEKNYKDRIVDYSFDLGNIRIINLDLKQTVHREFKSQRLARIFGRDFYHDCLFATVDKKAGIEIRDSLYSELSGKFLCESEKKEWFSNSGRNRLGSFLERCEISPAERSKIKAYVKAEGSQYKCLISAAHILTGYINSLNNNAAIRKQLDKQPRWF